MRWGSIGFALALAGCTTGLVGVNPDVDYKVVVSAVVEDCDGPPGPHTNAATAMEIGFTKVQAACEVFFVNATRVQQAALSADHTLDAGLLAATAVISPTNSAAAAAKALAITTAGVVLGKALIDDYNSIYAFNTHLYKVRQLVMNSMDNYIKTARASPPGNYCLAYTYVQKLAMLCTLAAMKANIDQQIALPTDIKVLTDVGPPPTPKRTRTLQQRSFVPRSSGPPSINYTVIPR